MFVQIVDDESENSSEDSEKRDNKEVAELEMRLRAVLLRQALRKTKGIGNKR